MQAAPMWKCLSGVGCWWPVGRTRWGSWSAHAGGSRAWRSGCAAYMRCVWTSPMHAVCYGGLCAPLQRHATMGPPLLPVLGPMPALPRAQRLQLGECEGTAEPQGGGGGGDAEASSIQAAVHVQRRRGLIRAHERPCHRSDLQVLSLPPPRVQTQPMLAAVRWRRQPRSGLGLTVPAAYLVAHVSHNCGLSSTTGGKVALARDIGPHQQV